MHDDALHRDAQPRCQTKMTDPRKDVAPPANALWGGRFAGGLAEIMERINASIDFDKRLYAEDIAGSKAPCAMPGERKVLGPEDGEAIVRGLEQILGEIEAGRFEFRRDREDIHMNVEARLAEI